MPGTYGTAAFKSAARRDAKPSVTAAAPLYVAPGIADSAGKHLPADATLRAKSPRFRPAPGVSSSNSQIDFYVPAGIGQGAGVARTAMAAFKQRTPRFVDPTRSTTTPGALDSDTPITGFADDLKRKAHAGTATFKSAERFKHDHRYGRPPGETAAAAIVYTAPGIGECVARKVPKFQRDGTQRFTYGRCATAGIDQFMPGGLAADVTKRVGGGFGKSTRRFTTAADDAKRDRGADYYVPPSLAVVAKGGATASFRASARFSSRSGGNGGGVTAGAATRSKSPNTNGAAALDGADFFTAPGVAAEATKKAGYASASFRSHSPRFDRIKSETANVEFAPLPAALPPCPATAGFRSTTPRDGRSKSANNKPTTESTSADYYSAPSFVDEILNR
jgi:hypothetical protein